MFDIGWTELVLVAVVAVVVIGPKDLPRAMRFVGQWVGKMKRMSREFQNQFNEALRETELDSVRKDIEKITKIDPLGTVRKELTGIETSMRAPAKPSVAPAVTAPVAAAAPATPAPPAASEPVASTGAPAPTPGAAT
jgi:sec-independent protein translocase protein TatB